MLVDCSTTWLLVRIIPVPAACEPPRPVADAITVLMSTIAELTLLVTAWTSIGWLAWLDWAGSPLLEEPLPPELEEPPIGGRWIGFCAVCAPLVIEWRMREVA